MASNEEENLSAGQAMVNPLMQNALARTGWAKRHVLVMTMRMSGRARLSSLIALLTTVAFAAPQTGRAVVPGESRGRKNGFPVIDATELQPWR